MSDLKLPSQEWLRGKIESDPDLDVEAGLAMLDAPTPEPRKKGVYVGAPACFALELACKDLNAAFGGFGCYLVGSALERPDWRDIDVRLILADEEFDTLFPGCRERNAWEFNTRWLVMTTAISGWLKERTGLPVDFQFQPQTHANECHKGRRNALGLSIAAE